MIIRILFLFLSVFAFSVFSGSSVGMYAEILAKEGIIVRHESPEQYRLSDPILRQEMTGIALQVADVFLPQEYVCRGYFSDVSRVQKDGWVCRAAERARDQGIITSANKTFRPRDFVTRAEALAIVVQASGMKTYPENYTSNWLRTEWFVDWQTKLLSSLPDCRIYNHGISCEDGKDGNMAMGNFRPHDIATRADVFEFLMYTPRLEKVLLEKCSSSFDVQQNSSVDTWVIALENFINSCPF